MAASVGIAVVTTLIRVQFRALGHDELHEFPGPSSLQTRCLPARLRLAFFSCLPHALRTSCFPHPHFELSSKDGYFSHLCWMNRDWQGFYVKVWFSCKSGAIWGVCAQAGRQSSREIPPVCDGKLRPRSLNLIQPLPSRNLGCKSCSRTMILRVSRREVKGQLILGFWV